MELDRPLPQPMTPEAKPYWEGARDGKLMIPKCRACGRAFMYPRVLFEPPSQFKLGKPTEYAPRSVSDKWIRAYRFWLARFDDRFVAISAICTHLGCTPRYLNTEDKFKCPCHGSGYRGFASGWKVIATNFEGPAPRPMERFKLSVADDGQIVVDKSKKFQKELGQWDNPESFLKA